MAHNKRYNEEFQLEAAKLVVNQGYTFKEAAERLGATDWSIRQWVHKFRQNGQLPSKEQPVPQADELKQLRQENRRLQMENDILKKAAAFFAKGCL